MSGGFFRGTSADQDTRFSNKQAKLMKSQKFPPELEHLVDMTKVKIEVMKPWIASRVTELIGFEDEVLINFIYTLLDGKVVNGKEVQISLTGFMERNTGKFMKELWSLLLSAQQNSSGVPQQFLDAKEEETRKKQAETDRITNEIERKKEKEKREMEGGSFKKMDGDADNGRAGNTSLEQSKRQYRNSSRRSADEEKGADERSGSRGRSSGPQSPQSADLSPPPRHKRSRSRSKSRSNSRSYSNERLRSRKASRSPQSRGRSISSERRDRSPPRRSISPRRRHSPRRYSSPRRRYPSSRRRSISPSRYRSPSPRRQRMLSPLRRRYRSPIHHRSRSPVRRRSSSRSRSISHSPVRRRSPALRRRSRTPVRQRSPIYFRRRSPPVPRNRYRRSPSPRHRSPSPPRRRSPTSHRRSVSPVRRRSHSPQDASSPSAAHQSSPSPPIRRSPEGKGISPARSPIGRIRGRDKYSPAPNSSPSEDDGRPIKISRGSDSTDHHLKSPKSLRSSQRDLLRRNGSHSRLSPLPPPPYRSPSGSESPPVGRRGNQREERFLPPPPYRSPSGSESPPAERRGNQREERSKGSYEHSMSTKKKVIHPESLDPPPGSEPQRVLHDNSDSSMDGASAKYSRDTHNKNHGSRENLKRSSDKVHKEDKSPEDHADRIRNKSTGVESRKKVEGLKSNEKPGKMDRFGTSDPKELPHRVTSSSNKGKEPNDVEGDRTSPLLKDIKGQRRTTESLPKLAGKGYQHDQSGPEDSRSGESDKERIKGNDQRKHKKSTEREEIASDDDSSSDSYEEDRKDAKRRRKEEKKSKKDERRRRREERHRRKEEKRAEKRRRKLTDATGPPSDSEGNLNGNSSDGERIRNQKRRSSGMEQKETDPKEIEIALREKALESLRAKKGISR